MKEITNTYDGGSEMEDLQSRLNILTNTTKYRFKVSVVKEIINELKEKLSNKDFFNQAIEIDEKHHQVNLSYEKIMKIINEFLEFDKINLKYTPNEIKDGVGNIAVSYDGNPYLTLRLALMSLRTHNNMVFFSKRYYAINTKIIETINMISEKKLYAKKIFSVEYDVIDGAIAQNQHFFNLLIYIGDKRKYQILKKKISIPTLFNGFGIVDVFVQDKSFREILLDIDKFASENNITINYYDNTSTDETIEFINKYDISDCFVLLSKNTDIIYKFISEIKAKSIYINKNPFENYTLGIKENDLIYSKNISMN